MAYYITAHGYGHGTRSCDILNALRAADPTVPIIVKTDLPMDFMTSRLSPDIAVRPGAFDVGLIQKDSIQVDLKASLQALINLYDREDALIEQEERFLSDESIGVVVTDIPAIPLAAAQRAGISNLACGNFGWNWIYSEFAEHDSRWQLYVDKFADVYAQTDLLMRQPFAEPMKTFPKQIDLPLLAKPGKADRALLSDITGADPNKPWVLISFTSLNLDPAALEHIKPLQKQYEFFSVEPLSWPGSGIHALSRLQISFADTLASVDYVISKPGFGIVSECIANRKPIIYSDRKNFLEYPILVEVIERYCRHAFISNTELYSGKLARSLEEARSAPNPQDVMPAGGAEKAADLILSHLQNGPMR